MHPTLSTSLVGLLLALGLAMSLWVYQANPTHRANKGFPVMVLAILSWVVFYHFAQFDRPAFWFRLSAFSVFMFFVAYYFFVVKWFLNKEGTAYNVLGTAVLVYGTTFGGLALGTELIIADSAHVESVARPVFHSVGWWAFYVFVIIITLFINWALVSEYFTYPIGRRLKVQYFLLGLLLFAGFNILFNVALPVLFNVYEFYEAGNYSVVFILGFTGYAIVKENLFGIRVVLTAVLVALIVIVLAADVVLLTGHHVARGVKGVAVLMFLYLGYMLVQSVHREIAQREELQEIADELRRSNEAKTEFISIVSHQLRSPLNVTKGYLSLLLEDTYGGLEPEMRKPVKRLHGSNERLIRLVNDLLGISRIQMGTIELEREQVDLCKLAESVVDEFSMAAEERGIRLYAACRGVPLVAGDRQKLRNSILNLVDNSIRYTDQGSVYVSVGMMGEGILVKVKDTGEGLDEAEAKMLFESFQRGDVGRRHWTEGAGLGLYIAHQFVALHGGKMWAESEGKGKGSTFCIYLPVQATEQAA